MISEQRFAAVVASIYEAAADFNRWPDALRLMAQAYHAPAVVLSSLGNCADDMLMVAPQIDPTFNASYAAYYHNINPVWRLTLPSATGTILTDTMILERRNFVRTEFFNDFLIPQDLGSMLGAAAHVEKGRQIAVVAQRGRPFEDDDIQLYRRLAPHLQRAAQLNIKLAALEMRCAASACALDQLEQGVWLVDAEGRVTFANRTAAGLTHSGGGLRLVDGVLRAESAPDNAKLYAIVGACGVQGNGAGGTLTVSRAAGRADLALLVVPLRTAAPAFGFEKPPAAIIFATDPDRQASSPIARLRERFGLTPAEALLAVEVAKGDGLQACADRLAISRATARTHLAHVFQKTGVRRQAELVRLLMQT